MILFRRLNIAAFCLSKSSSQRYLTAGVIFRKQVANLGRFVIMKIKGGIVMPVTDSPLRYPGGKTKIYAKVKRIIDSVLDEENRIYIEPYAGGAGLALKLLYKGDVEQIILNDLDYHIYCFWKVCMSESQAFCSRIKNIDVSLEEWEKQKNIYINGNNHTELEIGFATFF